MQLKIFSKAMAALESEICHDVQNKEIEIKIDPKKTETCSCFEHKFFAVFQYNVETKEHLN